MKASLLNNNGGLRTFALVLDAGDEAMKVLSAFASEHQLGATHFTAIGAFSNVTVAYFDWETKKYCNVAIAEQVEVLTLAGDITHQDQNHEHKVHAHVVVGKSDATAHGGHLVEGYVRPTLEIVLTETPAHLTRRLDPRSGLALIDPQTAG